MLYLAVSGAQVPQAPGKVLDPLSPNFAYFANTTFEAQVGVRGSRHK